MGSGGAQKLSLLTEPGLLGRRPRGSWAAVPQVTEPSARDAEPGCQGPGERVWPEDTAPGLTPGTLAFSEKGRRLSGWTQSVKPTLS